MCEPATLVGLALAAGGSYVQHREQKKAMARQDQAIAQAQAEQDALQARKQERVLQSADANSTANVQQQMSEAEATNQARLQAVAQDAATTTGSEASQAAAGGGNSDTYRVEQASRAASELQKAISEAGMLAKAGAPNRMLQERGYRDAQSASDVDNISALMQQAATRSNLAIERAGRPSAGRMFMGSLMTTAAPFVGGAYGRYQRGLGAQNAVADSTRASFFGN